MRSLPHSKHPLLHSKHPLLSNSSHLPFLESLQSLHQPQCRLYTTKHTSSKSSNLSPSLAPQTQDPNTISPALTHLTSDNSVHMVTISPSKPLTNRTATARATILFSNHEPLTLIQSASLKKGDVISVARIAGIMGAKKTADLVPLCHNIGLAGVSVDVRPVSHTEYSEKRKRNLERDEDEPHRDVEIGEYGGIEIEATVKCNGQTGVEMEALTAVTAAGLTVYDMCKAVDRGMRMEGVRVVSKSGGRSGDWVEGERV